MTQNIGFRVKYGHSTIWLSVSVCGVLEFKELGFQGFVFL